MELQIRPPKILWLEDHLSTVRLLKEEFDHHFDLEVVPGLQALTRKLEGDSKSYEAVLLDMELADGKSGLDALQICKRLGSTAPILILSNDESLKTRITMLSLGVDDYLWKAMDPEEMMIRIRNAILRNSKNSSIRKYSLMGLELDPECDSVRLNGLDIEFSRIEFHLLMILLKNYPESASIETLRSEVWKLPVLENGTINTFVWKMNKKLLDWPLRIRKNGSGVGLATK